MRPSGMKAGRRLPAAIIQLDNAQWAQVGAAP